ncbi:hypothetical protein J7J13_01625 [bacterium]|nr:hypothetical protein [bacterium]
MKAKNINKSKKILSLALLTSGLFLGLFANSQIVWAKEITAENVIELVNKERKSIGLDILTENYQLSRAAQEKSEDMISNNYFAHTSPNGLTPWHWIEKNEYDYIYAGENLAINFSSAENQHKAWMESLEHRKNIINSNYKEIGVAVKKGNINGKEAVVTVQIFGAREAGAIVLSQTGEIKSNAKSESDSLIYETVEFNASNNPEAREIIAQVKNDEEESKEMIIVRGSLNDNRNILSGMAWVILPIILVLSIILNIFTLINSSRYRCNQFYLTKF